MEECLVCREKFKINRSIQARDQYYYLICSYCTAGKLMPRNRALKELKRAYQSEYFDWAEATGLKKYINRIQLFLTYSDWIEGYVKQTRGKVLDVGAGIPDFAKQMKNKGWDSYALEISTEQVKLLKKHLGNKKVFRGDFEKFKLQSKSLDILTFWHMLEHLINPVEAIRKSARILKPNGRLFAEFPNFDSFYLKLFGTNYRYFDLPGHLVYYNKYSLYILFEKNGFKIEEISYPLKLNGSFSLNLGHYIYLKTKSSTLQQIIYYGSLPLSLVLSFFLSIFGKTDLMRIAAVKKN